MRQLVVEWFGPPRRRSFILPVERLPKAPQVFAGMVEVE